MILVTVVIDRGTLRDHAQKEVNGIIAMAAVEAGMVAAMEAEVEDITAVVIFVTNAENQVISLVTVRIRKDVTSVTVLATLLRIAETAVVEVAEAAVVVVRMNRHVIPAKRLAI